MQHASEDVAARMLQEQRVEADRAMEALDAALVRDGDQFLSEDELAAITAARSTLLQQRDSGDSAAIKKALQNLESVSENYVARRMNASVNSAMRGLKVDEYTQDSVS